MFPSQLHIICLCVGVFILILIGACVFEESLLSVNVCAAKFWSAASGIVYVLKGVQFGVLFFLLIM